MAEKNAQGKRKMARGGATTNARTVEGRRKQERALQLRAAGHTLSQIANIMKAEGYGNINSPQHARVLIQRGLAHMIQEPAEDVVKMEMVRLDELTRKGFEVLNGVHALIHQGAIVKDEDGEIIKDVGPTLAAIDKLVKVMERRAKMLGIDKPTKVDAKVDMEANVTETVQFYLPDNGREEQAGDDE